MTLFKLAGVSAAALLNWLRSLCGCHEGVAWLMLRASFVIVMILVVCNVTSLCFLVAACQ